MAKFITKETKELITFIFIGGFMTLLNFILLFLLVEVFNLNYIIANIISYIIPVIISYFLNVLITFKHNLKSLKDIFVDLIKYCSMKLVILGIDTLCLYVLVNNLELNLYVSKIILTILFTVLSFSISKKIVIEE